MTQNHLQDFKSLLQKEITIDNTEKHFSKIANILMNKLCIVSGDIKYRIIEIEFYYKDKNILDVYAHEDKEQLKIGTWYFNGMGLDITFGNKGFGGILIRGIRTIEADPRYINGVSNSLKELFATIGFIGNKTPIYIDELEISFDETPFPTSRKLSKRKSNDNDFYDKPLRYLVEVNEKKHLFYHRERVRKAFNAKTK